MTQAGDTPIAADVIHPLHCAGHQPRPSISVVIETINDQSGPELRLEDVLDGLEKQSYPRDQIEIIVVGDRDDRRLLSRLRQLSSGPKIIESEHSTYYSMKSLGAAAASGDVIAFLDSDCVPSTGWAAAIADAIERGADATAGKTRYAESAPFFRTFNFFNFGYVSGDRDGQAPTILANNAAFKRAVFLAYGFDPRIRRSGAAHYLGEKLRSQGYRLVYTPEQSVVHNAYGVGEEILMRVKTGYDSVLLTKIDGERIMRETQYLKRSPFALLLIFARRVIFDYRCMLKNRHDLDISLALLPYFFVVSPLMRGFEMAAAIITLLSPTYFQNKYGW